MPRSNMKLFFLAAHIVLLVIGCSLFYHEHRTRNIPPPLHRRRIAQETTLPIRLALHSNPISLTKAEDWLMDVSDPDSKHYGHFWTKAEVIEAFQPTAEATQAVGAWLGGHNVTDVERSDDGLFFSFRVAAGKAETMFGTEDFVREREGGVDGLEVGSDAYSLPAEVARHVAFVTAGVKSMRIGGGRGGRRGSGGRCRQLLRKRETERDQVYDLLRNPNSLDACNDNAFMTPACIRALYNIPRADPKDKVSSGNSMSILAEAELYQQSDFDDFFRIFTEVPKGTCPKFDSSSGSVDVLDDMDGRYYTGEDQEMALDLSCAMPIVYPQNVTVCEFDPYSDSVGGWEQPCEDNYVHSISYGFQEDAVGLSPAMQEYICLEFLKFGLRGGSVFASSGDMGVSEKGHDLRLEGSQRPCLNERVFVPTFPASCPWVTSVGATEVAPGNTVHDQEVAANWYDHDGNYIGSGGGGFSLNFRAPEYQNDVVSHYFKTSSPRYPYFSDADSENNEGRYNRNGRGIPDIAANGKNYAIVEDGYVYRIGGTSASAPIVAAIFNRVIEERLRAGKGPIGFVNPVLYKHPEVLNDILEGSNGWCTPAKGFECAEGWDPVTGLGTPDYGRLLELFMNLP